MKDLLRRNPALAGLALLVVGIFVVRDALSDAARYDEYGRGPRVQASVTGVEPTGGDDSTYAIQLFWRDPDGESHRRATRGDNERGLAVRDKVSLALHPDDYSRFLFVETLEERQGEVVELFGVRAVNMVFVGLILAVSGLLLLALGHRLESPLPPEHRVRRAPVVSTNVRFITARRVALATILVGGIAALLYSFTPAFQFSTAENQAYLLGWIAGRLLVVGVLVTIWGLVSGNEWSWGGSAARIVVLLVLLGILGGRDPAAMLDRPESAKQEGQIFPKRP